jgi:type II restriction enzyme
MAARGNRGECSELYARLKILGEGKIELADCNLEKIPGRHIDVTSLTRVEGGRRTTHRINKETRTVHIHDHDGGLIRSMEMDELGRMAEEYGRDISLSKSTTTEVPREILRALDSEKVQAGRHSKTDLIVGVWDCLGNCEREYGFSIKSMIGNPSTILNASGATRINYLVEGLSEDDRVEINAIEGRSKILARAEEIRRRGGSVRYLGMESDDLRGNCEMMCGFMPEILGEMLRLRYAGAGRSLDELARATSREGRFSGGIVFSYESLAYKLKHLLGAVALGMNPGEPWDGRCETSGGCIVIKRNRGLVCYHADNRDDLNSYFFNNAGLDTPGTGRFDFGKLYYSGGEIRTDYVLQIRFLK